jgi:hypothetical protein
MTDLRQAAKQALLALWGADAIDTDMRDAITALKVALEQPEQEPVAWMYTSRLAGNQQYITRFQHDLTTYKADKVWPLYTTPPAARRPWQGLTDEEMSDAVADMEVDFGDLLWKVVCLTKLIEAKLKERNGH